jgi:glutaredoxin
LNHFRLPIGAPRRPTRAPPGNINRRDAVPVTVPDTDPAPDTKTATFFWRPGCGFCTRLRAELVDAGVALDERNIWEDPEAAAFVRSVAGGNETVPTVVAGGRAMVNPRGAEVVAALA